MYDNTQSCCYWLVTLSAKLLKTNNYCEAFHRAQQRLIQMDHPSIWKFIKGLQVSAKNTNFVIETLIAGNNPPQMKGLYRRINTNIETIVADYANRTFENYLRGIAHKISICKSYLGNCTAFNRVVMFVAIVCTV